MFLEARLYKIIKNNPNNTNGLAAHSESGSVPSVFQLMREFFPSVTKVLLIVGTDGLI